MLSFRQFNQLTEAEHHVSPEARKVLEKDKALMKANGYEGEGSYARWKQDVRDGKLDYLVADAAKNKAAFEVEAKQKRKEKNDAWKEKNLPRLRAKAAARREAEAEETNQRRERARAYYDGKQNAVYLNVPYAEKNAAKFAGAKWDVEKKSWYAPGGDTKGLEKWLNKPAEPKFRSHWSKKTDGPLSAPTSTRRGMPTRGTISADDPSVYGDFLLGHEGESWASIRHKYPEKFQ